jgi:hypothetical protein
VSNFFYTPTGTPGTATPGASAPIRAEFQLISAAFDLFPSLAGSGGRAVVVNPAGTALTLTTGRLTLGGDLSVSGTFPTTLLANAPTNLTLPMVDGTLMTFGGGAMTGDLTLRGDPTSDLMAVTRRYVDTHPPLGGPYLSLAGGVLSGPLSVAGNGVTYTGVGFGHAMAFGWDGAAVQAYHDGASVGALATQAYVGTQLNGFLPLGGGILTGPLTGTTVTASTYVATLSGGGRVVLHDPAAGTDAKAFDFVSTSAQLRGRLMNDSFLSVVNWLTVSRSGMTTNSVGLTATEIDLNGQAKISGILTVSADATITGNAAFGGSATFGGNATITGSVTAATFTANASVSTVALVASGTITGDWVRGNTAVQAGPDGSLQFYTFTGNNRRFAFANQWSLDWSSLDGSLTWVVPGNTLFVTFAYSGPCSIGVNWLGPWQGNGAYIGTSDERMKTDIEDATVGLAEVLAISPIRFRRMSYDGVVHGRYDIGFSAQELRMVIPDAVIQVGGPDPDKPGSLKSDDPVLGLMLDPVVAAIVNGMKTLNTRLAALEGKAG